MIVEPAHLIQAQRRAIHLYRKHFRRFEKRRQLADVLAAKRYCTRAVALSGALTDLGITILAESRRRRTRRRNKPRELPTIPQWIVVRDRPEANLDPEERMWRVRWSHPDRNGLFLYVRHYPGSRWGRHACEREAEELNRVGRKPWTEAACSADLWKAPSDPPARVTGLND